MRRKKYVICVCVGIFVYCFFGIHDYLFAWSFDDEFSYPLNIDLRPVIDDVLAGNEPSVAPINHYPYTFLTKSTKCSNLYKIDLVILVKSALEHFEQRMAIRLTYGRVDAVPDRVVKILFFLGVHRKRDLYVASRVDKERGEFADIIQSDFEDNYYNMTIKTILSFRWAYEHCAFADYYLFTDDDMYISVGNLLSYLDAPAASTADDRVRKMIMRNKAYEQQLVAGYVFESAPQRFWSSKWRVSLDEYPWNRWPAYVTAGAYVVSNKSMRDIYVASLFVKHFRFDDIYLGIVAKKLGIELTHSDQFHFYKKPYTKADYKEVIASHGYGDPHELISVWNEQNSLQHHNR